MRRLLGVTVIVALFAGAACTPAAPAGPEPGSTDPASAPPASASSASVGPTASPSPSPDPTEDETEQPEESPDEGSVEEQGDDPSEPEVSFKDSYTYPDGLEVEVSQVRHGRITARDVERRARQKKGTPWVQLTVRVRNGSKKRLNDPIGSFTVIYGSDGDEADPIAVPSVDDNDLPGTIARGATKVCSSTFGVPLKDQDRVFLEFTPDINHGSVLFSGSIA